MSGTILSHPAFPSSRPRIARRSAPAHAAPRRKATEAPRAMVRPAPQRSPGHRRTSVARRLVGILTSLLLVASVVLSLAGFLFLAVGPHVLGYRTATMLTGSMSPGIEPGDVVVSVPKPTADVQVGDVITYSIPVEDHRVETHRITEVTRKHGAVTIRTKGDANNGGDPWQATLKGDTVWELKAVVPELGHAIIALRSPWVQHGALWVALAGFIGIGLVRIWGGPDEDADDA